MKQAAAEQLFVPLQPVIWRALTLKVEVNYPLLRRIEEMDNFFTRTAKSEL